MTEKIRCPKCSARLTKKISNTRYYSQDYTLICKPCEKLHPYKGFRAEHNGEGELKTLRTYFNIVDFKFVLLVNCKCITTNNPYSCTYKYSVEIFLDDKSGYSYKPMIPIKTFDGYDLIDQNVDVLDYYSLFSFFKKECRLWHKWKAFL